MDKLTKVDRAAARRLGEITLEAVADRASELGLTAALGRGSYDPETGTVTVKVTYSLGDAEEKAFAREAGLFGLEPGDYGATFKSRGRTFRLVAFNLRAPKFPLLAEDVADGRRYKLTEAAIPAIVAARGSK